MLVLALLAALAGVHHKPRCHTYIVPVIVGAHRHHHREWDRETICGRTVTVYAASWS